MISLCNFTLSYPSSSSLALSVCVCVCVCVCVYACSHCNTSFTWGRIDPDNWGGIDLSEDTESKREALRSQLSLDGTEAVEVVEHPYADGDEVDETDEGFTRSAGAGKSTELARAASSSAPKSGKTDDVDDNNDIDNDNDVLTKRAEYDFLDDLLDTGTTHNMLTPPERHTNAILIPC